jgi:hypothetical protein
VLAVRASDWPRFIVLIHDAISKDCRDKSNEIEITPAMVRAGVEALEPFLLVDYQVFDFFKPKIGQAIWSAMYRVAMIERIPL